MRTQEVWKEVLHPPARIGIADCQSWMDGFPHTYAIGLRKTDRTRASQPVGRLAHLVSRHRGSDPNTLCGCKW